MHFPTVIELTLFNAATATVLAIIAAAVGRFARRPGIAHALWALVLLKLVFPPVIEMGVVPQAAPLVAVAPLALAEKTLAGGIVDTSTSSPLERRTISWQAAVLMSWGAGSSILLLLAVVRVRRFQRLVASSPGATSELNRVAQALARRMNVRCPVLKTVTARVSPMLWFPGHTPTLLFPAGLLPALAAGERDALLAHELAHVKRRDHLLRFVELVATIAFWWHPVVWWARRSLRRLEEQSCDAVVLDAFPGEGSAYARGLVKTVEFLAGSPSRVPALASGAMRKGDARNLEERLKMILNETTPGLLSRTQRTLLAFAAVGALLIVPSWADPEIDAPDDAFNQRMHDLELQSIELAREIQHLEERRHEIEYRRMQLDAERKVAVLRRKAQAAHAQGLAKDAERLQRQADDLERRAAQKIESYHREREQVREARALELELRGTELDAERAMAQQHLRHDRNVERELARQLETQKLGVERERARQEMAIAQLKEAIEYARHLESIGEHEKAEAMKRKIRDLKDRLEADKRSADRVY